MKKDFKLKKNLQQVLLFSSSVALSLGLLFLSSLVPKETRYQITETGTIVTEIEYKQLKKIGRKIDDNLTVVALFFALLSVPPAILAGLIVSNRLGELELEALEYNKKKNIKQIQVDSDIQTEQEICDTNRKAAVTANFEDVKKAFVEMGKESKWIPDTPPERNIQAIATPNTQIPANPQQQALTASEEASGVEKKTPSTPGQKLLSDLASSDKSMLLTGSTGAGKSHTLNAWLESVYAQARAKKQIASIWILGSKKDSFCGLREAGRLTIFDPLDPQKAFKLIENIYKNFCIRLAEATEEERKKLPPLRLILEDWSATVAILKEHYAKLWSKIALMLLHIITVGREYNVCLLVLAQSLNLKALGLVEDANLRANMAIVAQGLVTEILDPESGEIKIKGDYGLVYLAIKNQYIVPDSEVRQIILAALKDLIPESKAKQIPVFFTTLGDGNVGLLPFIKKTIITFTREERDEPIEFDIEKFRQSLIQQEPGMAAQATQTAVIERPTRTHQEIIDSLNRLYKEDEEESESPVDELLEQVSELETVSELFQDVKQADSNDSGDSEPVCFTHLKLGRKQAKDLVLRLKREMKHNQTQIIWALWNARPGKTKAYERALAEYKELMGEEEENES